MKEQRITFTPEFKGEILFPDVIECFYQVAAWYKEHKKTCDDLECIWCGMMECPHSEPLHRHHDGCPVCDDTEVD